MKPIKVIDLPDTGQVIEKNNPAEWGLALPESYDEDNENYHDIICTIKIKAIKGRAKDGLHLVISRKGKVLLQIPLHEIENYNVFVPLKEP